MSCLLCDFDISFLSGRKPVDVSVALKMFCRLFCFATSFVSCTKVVSFSYAAGISTEQ